MFVTNLFRHWNWLGGVHGGGRGCDQWDVWLHRAQGSHWTTCVGFFLLYFCVHFYWLQFLNLVPPNQELQISSMDLQNIQPQFTETKMWNKFIHSKCNKTLVMLSSTMPLLISSLIPPVAPHLPYFSSFPPPVPCPCCPLISSPCPCCPPCFPSFPPLCPPFLPPPVPRLWGHPSKFSSRLECS